MDERSRAFLVRVFRGLRDQRQEEVRSGSPPSDPVASARVLSYYEALIAGLEDGGAFPSDPGLREFIVGMAEAIDQENEYETTVLEHRACAELIDLLPG
jgi:hypothetical protein